MIVRVPAILVGGVVGCVVVFATGYYVVSTILNAIVKRIKGIKQSQLLDSTIDERIKIGAVIAGTLALIVAILFIASAPREFAITIWYSLIGLGFLIGFLTFALSNSDFSSKAKSEPRTTHWKAKEVSKSDDPHSQTDHKSRTHGEHEKQQDEDRESQSLQSEYRASLHELQTKHDEINAIKKDLYSIFGVHDDRAQERGRLLANILNRFFTAYNIPIIDVLDLTKQDGERIVEHIEGEIDIDGFLYLVEVIWQNEPVDTQEISYHLVRLFNSGHQGGIFISKSGFTQSAVLDCKEVLSKKTVVLCGLDEIVSLLEKDGIVKEFLTIKITSATKDKNPLFKPLSLS